MAENGIDVDESGAAEEHVVMTPKSKTSNCTVIAFDRRKIQVSDSMTNGQVHVAGGNNKGFIVNKQLQNEPEDIPSQISLEFKVFLVNASTGMHTLESRKLRFWFKDSFHVSEQPKLAQEFFKELVSPDDFPRDYVGFLMRIMKLLKNRFPGLRKVEIEMRQLEETDTPPERPISADESGKVQVTEPKILEMIESAYPNPMTVRDMAKQVNNQEEDIQPFLEVLQEKGLIKTLDNNAYTRVVQNEMHVKIVKQMPKMVKAKQPTIAIITAQFCEKLAVDAMIENQETFVRYTTVGESNVYTLGNMGAHRVVSTKLPSVGHTREAMIAAGNTTTRLLGTFQKVDYVFLIGVGGGVPHFTDYNRHVRLGDIVVSCPTAAQKFVYLYCDKAIERPSGGLEFETRGWVPQDFVLQEIASQIAEEGDEEWAHYMDEGMRALEEQEADFSRPPASSDKLYMAIGEKDIIEVAHPTPPLNKEKSRIMESRVHLGPIAAGRQVARDDHIRQELASRLGIFAYDSEFDSVLESVLGNRRDSFIVIRGVADYKDGTRRRDWQPHSALLASAFAKAIISRMEAPADE